MTPRRLTRAANAAGQVGGALVRQLEPIYQSLVDLCSHFHAVLDYPDEDIDEFRLENFSGVLQSAAQQLERLLGTCAPGAVFKAGRGDGAAGQAQCRKIQPAQCPGRLDRVIVTDIAGTTRDTVEQTVKLGSTLLPPAGHRRDPGDGKTRLKPWRRPRGAAAQEAELALFLCDSAAPLTQEDRQAMQAAPRQSTPSGSSTKPTCPRPFPRRIAL